MTGLLGSLAGGLALAILLLVGCDTGKDTARALDPLAKCVDVGAETFYCKVHRKMVLCDKHACLEMAPANLPIVKASTAAQEAQDDENTYIILSQ